MIFKEWNIKCDINTIELENIKNMTSSFSKELVPGFKLRNEKSQHIFDDLLGKIAAYHLLRVGITVKNLCYNDYWNNDIDFVNTVVNNKLEAKQLDNIHIEYWFKNGNWEIEKQKPHYHLDKDEYATVDSSSNNIEKNIPIFTGLLYLCDNLSPTIIFDNKNQELGLVFPKTLKHIVFDGGNMLHGHDITLYSEELLKNNSRNIIAFTVYEKDVKYTPYLDINQLYQWHYMKTSEPVNELPSSINNLKIIDSKIDEKNIKDVDFLPINLYEKILKNEQIFDEKSKTLLLELLIPYGSYIFKLKSPPVIENNFLDTINDKLKSVFLEREIISKEVCEWLINQSNKQVSKLYGEWRNNRHKHYSTYDIEIDHLPDEVFNLILIIFREKIINLIHNNFNIDKEIFKCNIKDAFIVKYDTINQNSLEPHKDLSDISVSIMLSKETDFTGGGIRFENGLSILSKQGDAIIHHSKNIHEAIKINSGIRMVLVFFIDFMQESNS